MGCGLKPGRAAADLVEVIIDLAADTALTSVAARSRASATEPARWHAVEVHRTAGEVDGACELTLCGSLARVTTGRAWPVVEGDVCPSCIALTR